ncbi:hypothetical protein RAS1_38590 [Phycisphaerae bacterium RAS1]|nr:hypothetical protein RAS1_38590 [Phycisphaerae bacterium RAS1]
MSARTRLTLAFSTLELVVVIAITAIIAAVAIPRFGGAAQEYRVDLAARRVAADLRHAQRQARLSSSSQTVVFDAVADGYELVGVAGLNRASSGYVVSLASEPYEVDLVSVSFDAKSQVQFDGFGRPDKAGVLVLRCGTHVRQVTLDVDSGQVTVQ